MTDNNRKPLSSLRTGDRSAEQVAVYREAIKVEAKRGYAGNRESERHPAYVAADPDTLAIAKRFNKSAWDVATDIVAVRLSNDRYRAAMATGAP